MDTALSWIGIALAALVGVAVCVAAWEHHRLLSIRRQDLAGLPPLAASVDVDVDIDTFMQPAAVAQGDSADRRAALEQAMGRRERNPAALPTKAAAQRPLRWLDTEPMVGPGAQPASRAPSKAHSA